MNIPRKTASLLFSTAIMASLATYSTHSAAQAKVVDGTLTGTNGMTLYTFDKDTAGGGSACVGPCASNWPPLYASDGEAAKGDYSIVMRDDGRKQWAYKGKPLYYWSKDQKPGDKSGDGFNNLWHVAKP